LINIAAFGPDRLPGPNLKFDHDSAALKLKR
jgi:hypothetical protein